MSPLSGDSPDFPPVEVVELPALFFGNQAPEGHVVRQQIVILDPSLPYNSHYARILVKCFHFVH